jgi:hypothetical protein
VREHSEKREVETRKGKMGIEQTNQMTKHNDMKQRIQSMDSRLSGRGEGLTMVV